jgi:hypothetical protein
LDFLLNTSDRDRDLARARLNQPFPPQLENVDLQQIIDRLPLSMWSREHGENYNRPSRFQTPLQHRINDDAPKMERRWPPLDIHLTMKMDI